MTPLGPTLLAQIGANLQLGIVSRTLVEGVVWLLAITVLAATPAGAIAVFYRWYVRERIQTGLALLFGVTAVVLDRATTALSEVFSVCGRAGGRCSPAESRRIPRWRCRGLRRVRGGPAWRRPLRRRRRAGTRRRREPTRPDRRPRHVGTLPDDIGDIIGYDPMPDETQVTLANRRLLFPRRLTKTNSGTGWSLGSRPTTASATWTSNWPTTAPSTTSPSARGRPASARRCRPRRMPSQSRLTRPMLQALAIGSVWERAPAKRVLTGELRGVADDVVTVAIDAADTPNLTRKRGTGSSRSRADRSDREFASLLRAADETMGSATVAPGARSTARRSAPGSLGGRDHPRRHSAGDNPIPRTRPRGR